MNSEIVLNTPGVGGVQPQGSKVRAAPISPQEGSSSPSQQLVSLLSLSPAIADRFIAESLAETLHRETGGSILLVHLQMGPAKAALQEWPRIRSRLNGRFGFQSRSEHCARGFTCLDLNVSADPAEAAYLQPVFSHLLNHFQYVLLQSGPALPVPLMIECLVQSDRAFLLLQPTSENLYHRELLLREVRSHPRNDHLNLKTIVCREKHEEHFNKLLQQMGTSVHGFVHGCPGRADMGALERWDDRDFQADIRRLAREVGRCRVGLALSSGGARGLAHIGVIQVLEEHGIEIDVLVGCSMGAYVGAVWAYGYDGIFMEKLAREVEHRWGLLELIDPFILPRQGFLRGEKVKRRLKRSIGDVHFSELVRPFRVVATHLGTLERAVFSSGEVAEAVHASSAIPGACAPVSVRGELYIDGGIADPMPVDVLEEMGIERIIAVNTIPTAAYLRCRMEMEREQAELRGKKPGKLRTLFNQYLNYFAPGNILDTILRSIHGAQMRVAEQSCRQADIVLRPLSFDGRWHDFRNPGKYIAIGRREAEERMDEIKALVKRKDPAHESKATGKAVATVA